MVKAKKKLKMLTVKLNETEAEYLEAFVNATGNNQNRVMKDTLFIAARYCYATSRGGSLSYKEGETTNSEIIPPYRGLKLPDLG